MSYFDAPGGLPPQTALMTQRAVFTEAYAVIPRGCLSDIVASLLPGWEGARAWVLARPMTGFSETFAHLLLDLAPGGGSDAPETEGGVQGALFVVGGRLRLTVDGQDHDLAPGGFAYLPPGAAWGVRSEGGARVHWIRKAWEPAPGLGAPDLVVSADQAVAPTLMPGTDGRWATTRFVDPLDLRHDMHVTIVTLMPGATIPFEETHVMEHSLHVLTGKAAYRLNRDWVEVEAGDTMWLRAFCPQAAYAGGPGPFRYLLYKDVNRLPRVRGVGGFGR